jgi:hypothetical protein
MPGVLRLYAPGAVFPASLSVAFTEVQTWPARANEYHDGATQRTAMLGKVQRTWKLTKRLSPSALSALLAFWQAQGAGAFWFYNPSETLVYDPTGVATVGRYRVRFEGPWSQSIGLARADVPVQLVETIVPGGFAGVPFTLYGTGVSAPKMLLAANSVDPHWTLAAGGPDTAYPGPNMLVVDLAGYNPGYVNPPYGAQQSYGQYICNRPWNLLTSCPPGNYTIEQTFDLTWFDPTTVEITGTLAADNYIQLYVNDALVYQSTNTGNTSWPLTDFSIFGSDSGPFVAGANTIKAVVGNAPYGTRNPEALLIQITAATATTTGN